ncbi:alpha/beta hydrolase [Sphingomonas sp. ABOLD]|nr:alpha/beta hydrolase [Sphingomonas sp. ABOLD]
MEIQPRQKARATRRLFQRRRCPGPAQPQRRALFLPRCGAPACRTPERIWIMRRIAKHIVRRGLWHGLAAALACSPAMAQHEAEHQHPPRAIAGTKTQGSHVEVDGARIWYASIGHGTPVVLLHGGMASSRSWDGQVPALVAAGYRVILIDSRGHGRSTLGPHPLRYELLADDVRAVLAHLHLARPIVIGWSDGGIVALMLAMRGNARPCAVYAFGANMDKASVRPGADDAPILATIVPRLAADYAALAPDPNGFGRLAEATRAMQAAQQDIGPAQLATIRTAVTIAGAEDDEFILPAHFRALAGAIPSARLELFPTGGHFVPWKMPDRFNRSLLTFLAHAPCGRRREALQR